MLNLQEDSTRPGQMNLKQLIFTVGLLISFAAGGTNAQAGNSDTPAYASSLPTSTAKDVNETSTAPDHLTSTLSPVDPDLRFCNETSDHTYETKCMRCDKGQYEPCKAGELHMMNKSCSKVSPGLWVVQGCKAACLARRVNPKCCHGYYGANCSNICPGDSKNPCNGHGTCLSLNGSCVCESEFTGEACELCVNNTKYGPNCSQVADNPCNKSDSLCGANSWCLHTGPGTFECVCDEGYHSLGNVCVPLDPCLFNNGGCDSTQDCISQSLSQQVKCQCKLGYERHTHGKSCKLKDMCSPGLCGLFADCETTEPLKHTCVCHGSYYWNGEACSGNIKERLRELSTQDSRFKDNIWYMLNITSKVYDKRLTRYGPFTIFVPTDQAFRNAFNETELDKLMKSDLKMKQILNQHILPVKFLSVMTPNSFYNLQGNMINFQMGQENGTIWNYYNRLPYDSAYTEKSKLIAVDIFASNGVIHLIRDVMGLKDDQFEDSKETVMDLIKNQPDYSTMYSMIRAANLSEMFSTPNTTVLITNNRAWATLSLHDQNYLATDKDGLAKLALILKVHIFPGVIDVTDMINLRTMKSSANIEVKVQVSREGQIQLNTDVNITRANIPISFGLGHRVDKVIVPSYLTPFMTNICEEIVTEEVWGPCRSCDSELPCSKPTDKPTGRRRPCDFNYDYGFRHHLDRYNPVSPWIFPRFPYFPHRIRCLAICMRQTKVRIPVIVQLQIKTVLDLLDLISFKNQHDSTQGIPVSSLSPSSAANLEFQNLWCQ